MINDKVFSADDAQDTPANQWLKKREDTMIVNGEIEDEPVVDRVEKKLMEIVKSYEIKLRAFDQDVELTWNEKIFPDHTQFGMDVHVGELDKTQRQSIYDYLLKV